MKKYLIILFPIVLLAVLLAIGWQVYSRSQSSKTAETDLSGTVIKPISNVSGWQLIEVGKVSILIPPGWVCKELQGIDSYVAQISGSNIELNLNFGIYTGSDFKEDNMYFVKTTYEDIHGTQARINIATKEMTDPNHIGQMEMHIRDAGSKGLFNANNGFIIGGHNIPISDQETVLKIFRSLEFKN